VHFDDREEARLALQERGYGESPRDGGKSLAPGSLG
jgi:hypothetical protein